MANWNERLLQWRLEFGIKCLSPCSDEIVDRVEQAMGPFPSDLREFYRFSNGIQRDWFSVLPIADPSNQKKTWDDITKANGPNSKYMGGDKELLNRFLVFADIGGGCCAAFDRSDDSVWYEEGEEIRQTDLNLHSFIEVVLREVKEL